MRTKSESVVRSLKAAVLSVVAVGMLHGSACTLGDVRLNVWNGTLAFVKGYTTDLWEAVFPAADEFVGFGGE